MQLKAKIKGKEYRIIQGNTFAEEYNETLDSGVLMLDGVERIEDLKPYDDVFIYDSNINFNGYANVNSLKFNIERYSLNSRLTSSTTASIRDIYPTRAEDYLYLSQSQFELTFHGINQKIANGSVRKVTINVSYQKIGLVAIRNFEQRENCIIEFSQNGNTITITRNDPDTTKIPLELFPSIITFNYDNERNIYACTLTSNSYISTDVYSAINEVRIVLNDFVVGYNNTYQYNGFYKHLLVDQFNEQNVVLGENVWKYKIQLFSETKGLEAVQLPNVCVTQPLKISKKKSVYEYLVQFVDLYTPKFKMASPLTDSENLWYFQNKYSVDPALEDIFGDVYAPDFQLNTPNLRDVLSQLMLVKDRIPVVHDDLITSLDITKRTGEFDKSKGEINYVDFSRSSDNHCDNLKRTYNNALSQDNSCRYVEYLSFRNNSESLLTLDNMRIETRYPIYKINKVYMCYYKKVVVEADNNWAPDTSYEVGDIVGRNNNCYRCKTQHISNSTFNSSYWDVVEDKMFLCKQDITKLVKMNTERNLLNKDFDDFTKNRPDDIDEMAEYRMGTVGYDIGSNIITGWGEKYTYVWDSTGWWSKNYTYIQNIANLVDTWTPFGIYKDSYVISKLEPGIHFHSYEEDSFLDYLINPYTNANGTPIGTLGLKAFFFEIDYNGFYNGTVVHSKDGGRDNIVMNDNSSASLTILEKDGLFEKEKVNRFGNKAVTIPARYTDINDVQELGTVYNKDNDTDIIIYRREYSIFDNVINVTYQGTKDYVLKNYFTSVFAKLRTYNLMSYGESVRRSENFKNYILLSKDSSYYENNDVDFAFENMSADYKVDNFLSFIKPSEKMEFVGLKINDARVNYAYFVYNDEKYASDLNAFVSGPSLCFNLAMFDNVSGGIYVKTPTPFNALDENNQPIWPNIAVLITQDTQYTGSVQDWLLTADETTGFAEKMSFFVSHTDLNKDLHDKDIIDYDWQKIQDIYANYLWQLPKVNAELNESNKIGINDMPIMKDNKELIDMTFQFEPVSDNEDVVFSQWLMKLCDLITNENKVDVNYNAIKNTNYAQELVDFLTSTIYINLNLLPRFPRMVIKFPTSSLSNMPTNVLISASTFSWSHVNHLTTLKKYIESYKVTFSKIKSKNENYITFVGTEEIEVDNLFEKSTFYTNTDKEFAFRKIKEESGYTFFEWGTDKNNDFIDIKDLNWHLNYENNVWGCDNEYSSSPTNTDYLAADFYYGKVYFANNEVETQTYYKNMYIKYSTEKMPKEIVYNTYTLADLSLSSHELNVKITDLFSLASDPSGVRYINIYLGDLIDTYQHDITYIDGFTVDGVTYIIDGNEVKQDDTVVATIVNNMFTLNDVTYYVNYYGSAISTLTVLEYFNYKSVQFWYYDEKQECCQFVFGVNFDRNEIANTFVRINVSLLRTKDTRVFDLGHNEIGKVHNYAESDNTLEYGENQYYDETGD